MQDTRRDIWHYAREQAAAQVIATLGVGLISAASIIEPRRKGKTTFLLDDLVPAAQKAGYLPLYLNLAAATGDLESYLAATLRTAIDAQRGLLGRLRKLGRSPVRKLAGRGAVSAVELGAELHFATPADRGGLAEAFETIDRLKQPALLLLDEVHRLADESTSAVAWSLRSLLDSRRATVKTVATSSSVASYEALVTGEKKAFNRWFTRIALEPLGEEFVRHLSRTVASHYPRHRISHEQTQDAFEKLGRSPKFVRDYLSLRILDPNLAHEPALALSQREASKESGHESRFETLTPLQRTLVVALAFGERALFSEEARAAMGRALGADAPTKSVVQRALRTLAETGWVIRHERGAYLLTDELLVQWLLDQVRTGQLLPPASALPARAAGA
jgi:hypothetical protein